MSTKRLIPMAVRQLSTSQKMCLRSLNLYHRAYFIVGDRITMFKALCRCFTNSFAARLVRLILACCVISACGHGVDIDGEGDVGSRTGLRHCMLEDEPSFLIVDAYSEVYVPLARPGWEFSHWSGCVVEERECAFNISAELVHEFWFKEMPFLVAHFVQSDSDGDGVVDNDDAFPLNWEETQDSDCDGVGDNSDPSFADNVITLQGERCGAGVHLYVLGDGYTAAQQSLLLDDATRFMSFALADEGIRSYILHWNIHVIRTISAQSGIDSVYGVDEVDSAFGSGFNCLGIARLVCTNQYAVLEALIEVSNDADALPVLVVNSDRHGGSGGNISVFS